MSSSNLPKTPRFAVLSRLPILFQLALAFGIDLIFGLTVQAEGPSLSFPYKAQVIKEVAFVRSGPGQEYYPTEALKAGQMVEVYQHRSDGWCAIRPPEGSFSWVLSRQVEIQSNGLACAKEDQVPVVVGSRLNNLQDVVQVYLKRGEWVELLEEEGGDAKGRKEIFWKIAPPSGEFRWVWGQDIAPIGGVSQGTASAAASAPPSVSPTTTQGSPAPHSQPPVSAGSADSPIVSPSTTPGGLSIPVGSQGLSLQDFQQQFRQIELELATRIMGEPNRWQLQDLHSQVETLLGQAPDATSRTEARQLLARIVRFVEVQRQYGQIALAGRSGGGKPSFSGGTASSPTSPPGGPSTLPGSAPAVGPGGSGQALSGMNLASGPAGTAAPSGGVGGLPSSAGRTSESTDRFDAVGRLTRVVSTKPGAPTYALLNEQGEVISYVTPAPGINLRPFEGKWIGVSGVSGLMLEPRAKHVAVKEVAIVDKAGSVLR